MRNSIGVVIALALIPILTSCRPTSSRTVVVYVSEDQVFSEPILKDFERETGITVKSVFDTEESKSTGVTNRLIAEKDNPQADVYWANEPVRTEALKQRGISTPYVSPSAEGIADQFKDPDHYWTGFSARARVVLVSARSTIKPAGVMAYTDPLAKGRAAIANPLFERRPIMLLSFTIWGDERARTFMNDAKKSGVKMTTSNSEAPTSSGWTTGLLLVDNDDAVNTKKQGKPVDMIYRSRYQQYRVAYILPNAVTDQKRPSTENGEGGIDYLLSKETERKALG
jgi:iron(III) transport system substrate-binding protein